MAGAKPSSGADAARRRTALHTSERCHLGGLASPDALARHIRAQRDEAEALKADLEAIDAEAGADGDYHASLTRRYGLEHADAVIRWASTVEQELGAA